MNSNEFVSSLKSCWELASDMDIARTYATPTSLTPSQEFIAKCRDRKAKYREIFLLGLKESSYNIQLFDFSFFQFSFNGSSNIRYAFYPNPFACGNPDVETQHQKYLKLLNAGTITMEEYMNLMGENLHEGMVPILRYENSESQYVEFSHPCAHLHIGMHGDNRWPFRRILTPLAFFSLTLKQYYPNFWDTYGMTDASGCANKFESILISERNKCEEIKSTYFSENEARSFHFS